MKAVASELLKKLPGKVSETWLLGERFIQAFSHGTMSVEIYAPIDTDPQTPHTQDELYITFTGTGEFVLAGERYSFCPGHGFLRISGYRTSFREFHAGFFDMGCILGASGW